MKTTAFTLLVLTLVVFASCRSDKDRLVNKWEVRSATIYDKDIQEIVSDPNSPAEMRDTAYTILKAMEAVYEDRIYELKSDGTFTLTNPEGEGQQGTWEITDGLVQLHKKGGQTETWWFRSNQIEIYADSSLEFHLNAEGARTDIMLSMKPAPGHTVTPDYP